MKNKYLYYAKGENTTVLFPSMCNANCGFCFWNRDTQITKSFDSYFKSLKKSLDSINVTCVSISGGEPTMLKHDNVVKILKLLSTKASKVVLNTNGFKLYELLSRDDINNKLINFINISRHAIKKEDNQSIFNTTTVPTSDKLKAIIALANKKGIEVNCNYVFQQQDKIDILPLTDFCKQVGFSSLSLRKDIFQGLDIAESEKEIKAQGNECLSESSCPVCGQNIYSINGLITVFKYGVMETADYFPRGMVYENIIHQNGELSHYWDKIETEDFSESMDMSDIIEEDRHLYACGSSCGGRIETPSCRSGSCGRGYSFIVNNLNKENIINY